MALDLLLTNARLVTEEGLIRGNLGIRGEKIAGIFSLDYLPPAARKLDVEGKVVTPGAIDAHVHIPVGTNTHRGDFTAEGRAALQGGTTTVLDFVKSNDLTLLDTFWAQRQEILKLSPLDFGLHAVILHPRDLKDVPALIEQGVVSFKQFMCRVDSLPGLDTGLLYQTFQLLAQLGATATVHAEDGAIQEYMERELKNAGRSDPLAHAESSSDLAELEAVSRAILLAGELGLKLHIFHVSSAKAVRAIREAKKAGIAVTAETCPHYLAFTREDIQEQGPFLKVTPSLKSAEDRESLWQSLVDGSIDMVTSDHYAPLKAEKEPGWRNIWVVEGGVPGIETRAIYLVGKGVLSGKLTLERFVKLVATAPAKVFGLYPRKGALRVGADADVVVWDLEKEITVEADNLAQTADWTPFSGIKLKGIPVLTILRGRIVVEEGRYLGEPGFGQFIPRLTF